MLLIPQYHKNNKWILLYREFILQGHGSHFYYMPATDCILWCKGPAFISMLRTSIQYINIILLHIPHLAASVSGDQSKAKITRCQSCIAIL